MTAKPPELRRLPPTDPALELNIKRAHFQAMLRFNSVKGYDPHDKDPEQVNSFGQSLNFGIFFYCIVANNAFFFVAWMGERCFV